MNHCYTVMKFTCEEIEVATNNFDSGCLVGEGGFGRVYYAVLRHAPAAIKILNKVRVCTSSYTNHA